VIRQLCYNQWNQEAPQVKKKKWDGVIDAGELLKKLRAD